MTTPAVTITARRDSRWRCGVEFTGAPASFPAGHWKEAQLRQLRADPQLVVAETDAAAPEEKPAAPGLETTPTVQAALDMALEALRRATPGQARDFMRAACDLPGLDVALGVVAPTDAAIDAACAALAVGREDASWTKDRKPQVVALERVLGFDITADQRDAAWDDWLINLGKELTGG